MINQVTSVRSNDQALTVSSLEQEKRRNWSGHGVRTGKQHRTRILCASNSKMQAFVVMSKIFSFSLSPEMMSRSLLRKAMSLVWHFRSSVWIGTVDCKEKQCWKPFSRWQKCAKKCSESKFYTEEEISAKIFSHKTRKVKCKNNTASSRGGSVTLAPPP